MKNFYQSCGLGRAKGLLKGVQKHVKGGATANDLLDEISVYDMRNFEACIIYVGGNDCAKGTRVESFAEKYDQLISLLKTRNPACKVHLSEIAPRDVDVSSFNRCIEKRLKPGNVRMYIASQIHMATS